MATYSDLHRGTLQLLMNHSTMNIQDLQKSFDRINEIASPDTRVNLDDAIALINSRISQFDQKITKYTYDLTNEVFYIFHVTAETSMSKMQHSYNEAEIEFFKTLFIKITEDEHVRIDTMDALNHSKTVSKLRASKLLEVWVQEGYFQQIVDDDRIYLGPKILVEFKELLQSLELAHVKSCSLCESVAIWGDRCHSCTTIFHSSCIQKFIARSDKCPSCKEKWQSAAPATETDN